VLGEGDHLQSLSLEKLASLMNGRIVTRSGRHLIPPAGCKFGVTRPTSITFLTRSFKSEQALLTLLKNHDVRCVVVNYPNILTTEKWRRSGIAIIEVKNLDFAYMALAKFYRGQFSIPRIQVIGSSGKTTTTKMIGSVLNEKFHTLTTLQNQNSPLGVANNLFRLNATHQAVVLETGMKAPGIIRMSASLIRPDIGVVTSIHSAHLARFGSIRKIIAAKSELLELLSKDGTLIINWNDANCRRYLTPRFKGKIVRFGFSEQCDLWASDIQRQGLRTHFIVHTGELTFPCAINIIGKYNVGNALAAIAVGLEMGMQPKEITLGLERFEPIDGRLKVYHRSDGAVIIDDTFNANPDSTRFLIDELIVMAREHPVVLVIGDMERPSRDIEKYARRVHYNIGRQLAQGDFIHVLAIGLWAREYKRGAIQAGFPRDKINYYRTVGVAEASFIKFLTPGTNVVLKASPYTNLKILRLKYFHHS
jgi:UDP-N-acetylmuramoyl-tripeptide--D-alanyl-D-alanine ligase